MDDLKKQSAVIAQTNSEVASSMRELQDRTSAVKSIADTIFSISSQTNLLALNASIESARAGEAGRGFAVVADEIRQLAEKTRQETENIANILEQLSENAQTAADAVERSVTAAGAQDEMIAQASESFGAMNQNVNELVTDIGEIDTMLNNLSKANNQIVENIMQLSATTEEVTASSVPVSYTHLDVYKRQEVSIVANVAGTTTDPVYKAMEVHPLGPCIIIDTAGFGDESELGKSRMEKTRLAAEKTDIALLLVAGNGEAALDEGEMQMCIRDRFYHIYKRLPNCIGEQAEGIDGGGTCAIPIEASDGSGRDVFELYLFDSGTDAREGGYEAFDPKIIAWYRKQREDLREKNGMYVPSIVFQHIPMREYYEVLKPVSYTHLESACFGRAHYTKRADGRVYVFRTPHDGGNFKGAFCTDVWNTD